MITRIEYRSRDGKRWSAVVRVALCWRLERHAKGNGLRPDAYRKTFAEAQRAAREWVK